MKLTLIDSDRDRDGKDDRDDRDRRDNGTNGDDRKGRTSHPPLIHDGSLKCPSIGDLVS